MSIMTVTTKVTRGYLMGKTKFDLVNWILWQMDRDERLQDALEGAIEHAEKQTNPSDGTVLGWKSLIQPRGGEGERG